MATTGRCTCEGHWTYRKENWVVTQRGTAYVDGAWQSSSYCEVKCRLCQRKWRSNAAYLAELPDWEERKYKRLTYRVILLLIRADRIAADFEKGEIWKERKPFGRWAGERIKLSTRTQREAGSSGSIVLTHRYVVICDSGRRREISISRLLWMVYHEKVVPNGYDIDHADGDPENNAIANLSPVKLAINRASNEHGSGLEDVPF